MSFIFANAWILFIVVIFAKGFDLRYKSKKYINKNHNLKVGYDKLFKGWIIFGNIPWLIMGVGYLTNYTNSFFDYFNPKSLNPFVLIFHLVIIIFWILSIRWIYFLKGAEFLEKHPGLIITRWFNINGVSEKFTAKQIKLFLGLCIFAGIVGMLMMWITEFPKIENILFNF